MARITDGLNANENEIRRWEIHHTPESIAASGHDPDQVIFLRLTQRAPYLGSIYLAMFREGDPVGTPVQTMNLHPELAEELIVALRTFIDESQAEWDALLEAKASEWEDEA